MDPLVIAAIATFAGVAVTTVGNVIVGRMNTIREKAKSAEDAASQVAQQRLDFKNEQVEYWKSRYETCMEDRHRDR